MSDDLYPEAMLALAGRGRDGGRLEDPDATATLDNPLCGDRVTLDLRLDGDGRVVELGHSVRGCVLCHAAATVLAEHVAGLDAAGLAGVRDGVRGRLRAGTPLPDDPAWAELAVFEPVAAHRSRHECVLLPFEAALQALEGR